MRTVTSVVLCTLFIGLVFSQTCTITDNYAFDNRGYVVTLYNVSSAAECCAACDGFPECVNFNWVKAPSNANYKQCNIYNNNTYMAVSSSTTAGSVNRPVPIPTGTCSTPENGIDYNGGDLTFTRNVASASVCCDMCSKYSGCVYWTYLNSNTFGDYNHACYFKGANAVRTTNSGTISGSITFAPPAPLRSGKRGLGWFSSSNACSDLQQFTNASWLYNWAPQPPSLMVNCIREMGVDFIPMVWGVADAQRLPNNIWTESKYLLTFNEPNFVDQANMTPQQAASYWPAIETAAATNNMKISSPSASAGGATDPIVWLDAFFANCTNCKVDFITTHIYTCSAVGVRNFLLQFKKYNKPIWLTEVGCPAYGQDYSVELNFMTELLGYLDADPQFERYAWFGIRVSQTDDWLSSQVSLLNINSAGLSPLGKIYNNSPANSATTATATTTTATATTTTTGAQQVTTGTTTSATTTASTVAPVSTTTTSVTPPQTSTTSPNSPTSAAFSIKGSLLFALIFVCLVIFSK